MKHLPKHLRPRYRYLAVDVRTDEPADLDSEAVQGALWDETRALHGDVGSAAIDPTLVRLEFEGRRGTAIVRTRRDETTRGRAAVACIDAIGGVAVGIQVLGISGTVRACEENYISAGPKRTGEETVASENTRR